MLSTYRRMLAWRKSHPVLAKGGFALHRTTNSLVSYVREDETEAMFCAFNLGPDPVSVELPAGDWEVIPDSGFVGTIVGNDAELPPVQAVFARRK